ncbi:hypothetical protein BB560_004570, partial [Smittium megazygosporum]
MTRKLNPLSAKWHDLKVAPIELRLYYTLMFGQAFRWKPIDKNIWACALWEKIIALKETDSSVFFSVIGRKKSENKVDLNKEAEFVRGKLSEYFQLEVPLGSLCASWVKIDPNFEKVNNNIKRITLMIDNLCKEYGEPIDVECKEFIHNSFYSFPVLSSLSKDGVEEKLKQLGFGYRAKYIHTSAKYLSQNFSTFKEFEQILHNSDYQEAKKHLQKLSGVGPKVADCILLIGCSRPQAIPVDTHVMQIAKRDYIDNGLFSSIMKNKLAGESGSGEADELERVKEIVKTIKSAKSMNEKVYNSVSEIFYKIFGEKCIWAQTVLFVNDVKETSNESSSNHTNKSKSLKNKRNSDISGETPDKK